MLFLNCFLVTFVFFVAVPLTVFLIHWNILVCCSSALMKVLSFVAVLKLILMIALSVSLFLYRYSMTVFFFVTFSSNPSFCPFIYIANLPSILLRDRYKSFFFNFLTVSWSFLSAPRLGSLYNTYNPLTKNHCQFYVTRRLLFDRFLKSCTRVRISMPFAQNKNVVDVIQIHVLNSLIF